jgi:dienelactone hydrolase
MKLEVIKPLIFGAILGAIALGIVGFSWAGWMTTSTAEQRASDHADMQVAAALLPFCLQMSTEDPLANQRLSELASAGRFQRAEVLMNHGWATVPGSSEPNRLLAAACVDALSAKF